MKKLVISPHIDDEVLGTAGILDSDTYIFECGIDKNRNVPGWGIVTLESRMDEFRAICKESSASGEVFNQPEVNNYNLRELLPEIERLINKLKPEEVYIPHPSYNQDHREVYEAAFTALRPHDINHFVKKVFVYEQPHVFLWDWNHGDITVNYYIEIDIEKKLKLYSLIPSQVRDFRSPETIKSLAELRGKQSGYEYAEAYKILRYIK